MTLSLLFATFASGYLLWVVLVAMDLKAFDNQKVVIELSLEEFRTFAKMSNFVSNAYEFIERDLINIPRHQVEDVASSIANISKKLKSLRPKA